MGKRILQLFVFVTGISLAALGVLRVQSHPASDHPFYANSGFRIIAHRGGRGLGPENTLEVFKRSLAAGASVLEMDLRMTKDRQLVVLHDSTVNRTTDGEGPVREMTLAKIKTFDAGFHWTADGGRTFPFRGRGLTVPALNEVFSSFAGTPMVLEIKEKQDGIGELLCRTIEAYGRSTITLVGSFKMDLLDVFRSTCPDVATSAGPREALIFYALNKMGLTSIITPAMNALQVPETFRGRQVVTGKFVAAAHRRNLAVEVWTINDVEAMQRLIDAGVDGIMTDYPDRLSKLLTQTR